MCPQIELDIVYDDVKTIDSSMDFAFDFASNEFTVTTANKTLAETYQFKIVANFKGY